MGVTPGETGETTTITGDVVEVDRRTSVTRDSDGLPPDDPSSELRPVVGVGYPEWESAGGRAESDVTRDGGLTPLLTRRPASDDDRDVRHGRDTHG